MVCIGSVWFNSNLCFVLRFQNAILIMDEPRLNPRPEPTVLKVKDFDVSLADDVEEFEEQEHSA